MIATGLEQVFNNTNLFHYTSDPLERQLYKHTACSISEIHEYVD